MSFFDIQDFAYRALELFADLGYGIIDFVLNTTLTIGNNEYNLFGVMFGTGLFVFLILKLIF